MNEAMEDRFTGRGSPFILPRMREILLEHDRPDIDAEVARACHCSRETVRIWKNRKSPNIGSSYIDNFCRTFNMSWQDFTGALLKECRPFSAVDLKLDHCRDTATEAEKRFLLEIYSGLQRFEERTESGKEEGDSVPEGSSRINFITIWKVLLV